MEGTDWAEVAVLLGDDPYLRVRTARAAIALGPGGAFWGGAGGDGEAQRKILEALREGPPLGARALWAWGQWLEREARREGAEPACRHLAVGGLVWVARMAADRAGTAGDGSPAGAGADKLAEEILARAAAAIHAQGELWMREAGMRRLGHAGIPGGEAGISLLRAATPDRAALPGSRGGDAPGRGNGEAGRGPEERGGGRGDGREKTGGAGTLAPRPATGGETRGRDAGPRSPAKGAGRDR